MIPLIEGYVKHLKIPKNKKIIEYLKHTEKLIMQNKLTNIFT